ncbi:MAG: hypothetical protein WCG03_05835 [Kiritimatiellales bacterium]
MNPEQKIYCGVDVSKKDLDAFMDGKTIRFANTVTTEVQASEDF